MQLKDLQSINNPRRLKKRIARGGKRGAYSGRGLKGQTSRAGHRMQPIIRQFLKRYPKLRGYRFKALANKPVVIDLALLETKWDATKIVSPKTLIASNLISRVSKSIPEVKILGDGEITKRIKVAGCYVSKQAQEKIKKAGGSVIANKVAVIKKPVVVKREKPVVKTQEPKKVEKKVKAPAPKTKK